MNFYGGTSHSQALKPYAEPALSLISNSAISASTLKFLKPFFQPELASALSSTGAARTISQLAFLNTQAPDYQHRRDLAAALGKLGIYSGSAATHLSVAQALSQLKDAYPRPGTISHPKLLNKQEAIELAYWLISGLNADTCHDTEKQRILSAAFHLNRDIEPPAHLSQKFKDWINRSLANLRLSSPPGAQERLALWRSLVRDAAFEARGLQLDVRIPKLNIASASESSRLARFQIHSPGSSGGHIFINEQLLQTNYRELTEKATFALGVACIVHEMTHAIQHAQLEVPDHEEPVFRALRLACALDDELPTLHWLELFSNVPQYLAPCCLLPHELQAWANTREALITLGQNNPEDIKHIEQALLYISPTLKKMGLSNGQPTQHDHNPDGR